jgi:hypothetical protein
MQDRPTALELLDAVQRFLEQQVVPLLDGPRQFHARVAANVLGIVARELQHEPHHLWAEWHRLRGLLGGDATVPADGAALAADVRARNLMLAERIRRGDADHEPFRGLVLAHLHATTREKLTVANPRYLQAPG